MYLSHYKRSPLATLVTTSPLYRCMDYGGLVRELQRKARSRRQRLVKEKRKGVQGNQRVLLLALAVAIHRSCKSWSFRIGCCLVARGGRLSPRKFFSSSVFCWHIHPQWIFHSESSPLKVKSLQSYPCGVQVSCRFSGMHHLYTRLCGTLIGWETTWVIWGELADVRRDL